MLEQHHGQRQPGGAGQFGVVAALPRHLLDDGLIHKGPGERLVQDRPGVSLPGHGHSGGGADLGDEQLGGDLPGGRPVTATASCGRLALGGDLGGRLLLGGRCGFGRRSAASARFGRPLLILRMFRQSPAMRSVGNSWLSQRRSDCQGGRDRYSIRWPSCERAWEDPCFRSGWERP